MLKVIYLALLTTTGSALLLTSGSQGVGVQDRTSQRKALESEYQRLEKLTFTILKKGTSPTIDAQLRQIRDFFRTRGNLGARFLIEKLEAMNEDETRFLKGSDDPMQGLGEYVGYQVDHGKSNLTKYAVSNMLADMYGTLSPGTQAAVLKTITASYTPSTWGGHDIGALHLALLRIGPAAITYCTYYSWQITKAS